MSTPLRELITRLADDASTQATFASDPVAFLADHGWTDLDGQDVGAALGALVQELPIDHAMQLGEVAATGSFDGGLAGAVSSLEAVAGGLGEAAPPADGPLADPALGLDGAEVDSVAADGAETEGTATDGAEIDELDPGHPVDAGPDLDEIQFDPAGGIDDVAEATDIEQMAAGGQHEVDLTSGDLVDDADARSGLHDESPPDEPPLIDPLDGLEQTDEPDPWGHEAPPDDAVATHEPDIDDGT